MRCGVGCLMREWCVIRGMRWGYEVWGRMPDARVVCDQGYEVGGMSVMYVG